MPTFASHGELSITRDGQIMVIEGSGPWNLESLERSGEIALPIQNALKGTAWGVIAIIHGEPVHVPEAAQQLVQYVKNDIKNGRVGSALLVGNSNSPNFAENHIADIYRRAGETFEFFDDLESAKSWVLARIAATVNGKSA